MKWFKAVVVLILCCYVTFCLVMFPDACITAVSGALKLCVTAVIPTLFPFFVCSSLLIAFGLGEFGSRFLSGVMRPLLRSAGGSCGGNF